MKQLQKYGGLASLYMAFVYIVAIIVFLVILQYQNISDPLEKLAVVIEYKSVMYVTNLCAYIVFGFMLLVFSLALYEVMAKKAPYIMKLSLAFAVMWALALIANGLIANLGIAKASELFAASQEEAMAFWMGVETVTDGLGGGSGEFLGGTLTLLISIAALKSGQLHRGLAILGVVVGVAGVISTVPGLHDIGALFGLLQIVWFIWLGIFLLRLSKKDFSS